MGMVGGGDVWGGLGGPLGAAVRARRVELGLTQQRLAAQAGMSQGALSRLECGKGVPTLPLLERLAAATAANLLIALSPQGDVRVSFRAQPCERVVRPAYGAVRPAYGGA